MTSAPVRAGRRWVQQTGTKDRLAIVALLALFTGLLLTAAIKSLHSRMAHDAPIMFYIAFLIEHFHVVPYRETFDMNMPGSYLLYAVLGRLTGYSDLGIRIADLSLLWVLSAATWGMLRRISQLSAWAAAVIFPLLYLVGGVAFTLQREFLILVLLSLALALVFQRTPSGWLGTAGAGLLLGVCVTIKPQLALVWPLFALYQVQAWKASSPNLPRSPVLRLWIGSALGFLLPIAAMVVYLISVHALSAFVDVARNYWPLYGALNGAHAALSGTARLRYLLVNFSKLCGNLQWVPTALFGLWVALRAGSLPPEQGRQVRLLAALTLFFVVYPVFSGQFWPYHGLPLLYFAVVLTSLCLTGLRGPGQPGWLPAARLAALGSVLLIAGRQFYYFQPELSPESGRADQMAAYLAGHLRPGDRVQPLDWTSGAVHAMLLTRVQIATPFIYDFYFYHHVSHPYIQNLRRRFIADLTASKPRFILQMVSEDKPWPSGPDTTRQFPQLQAVLASQYHPVQSQNGYVIYLRNKQTKLQEETTWLKLKPGTMAARNAP